MRDPAYHHPPTTWPDHASAWTVGSDHYVQWADHRGWTRDENGPVTRESARGLMEWHWDQAGGRWCGGFVSFTPGNHTLICAEPLHIEPSVLCNRCPEHGWIREGRWIAA